MSGDDSADFSVVAMDQADYGSAQERLNDLSAASTQMRSDMASGHFSIEPDAARKAAQACRDQVGRIDDLLSQVGGLGHKVNFGQCQVGESMSQKFADKATGSGSSLRSLLEQSKSVLEGMARNYDDAARGYEQTDADNALTIRAE